MRPWIAIITVGAVGAVACGKGTDNTNTTAGKSEPAGSAAPKPTATPTPTPTPAPTGSATGSSATPATAPTSKVESARCSEPCLFLTDTAVGKLSETYKATCGGKEIEDLGFSDCGHLDYARNCIYAAHGLVYKQKRWKQQFANKPWYEPNATVTAKTAGLSATELANVHELYTRGKSCKKGVAISEADHERIEKWFAVLPKTPPVPELAFARFDPSPLDATAFTHALVTELGGGDDVAKPVPLTGIVARYIDKPTDDTNTDIPAAFVDALKARPPARLIQLDFDAGTVGTPDNPITEGSFVWFAYDAKDQLYAVAVSHYLYD